MRDSSANSTEAKRKWFRDREIILRSDGRIGFIKLRRSHQFLAVFAFFAILGWGIVGTVSAWLHYKTVEAKSEEILEAKLTIDRLRIDLEAYHARSTTVIDALSQQIGEGPIPPSAQSQTDSHLIELNRLNADLSLSFNRLSINVDGGAEESDRILASRQALIDQIAQLKSDVFDAKVQIVDLNNEAKQQVSRLAVFESEKTAAEERAAGLNRQIASLTDLLRERGAEVASLTDELSAVRVTLDVVKEANSVATIRASALSDQIARLQETLKAANDRGNSLNKTLAKVRQTLSTERRAFAELMREKDGYSTQAARLQGLLEDARLNRRGVEARLEAMALALAGLTEETQLAGGIQTGQSGAGSRFSEADIVAELEALTDDLSTDLVASRNRQTEMEQLIEEVLATLTEVAGTPVQMPFESAALDMMSVDDATTESKQDVVAQTTSLIRAIGALHRDQESIVASLSERAEQHIARAEVAMETAGLGPVELQALGAIINPEQSGQGGPYASLDFSGGTAQELEASVEKLKDMSERLTLLESVMACAPWITPVDTYQLTSKFGKRRDPINGKMAMHKGVDLAGWPKTPVYATAPGEVTHAGNHGRYGRLVEVDHGCGIVTRYAHLRSVTVEKGQIVTHREKVGTLGSTGRSTGPHVHYEIIINGEQVDPMKFVEAGRFFYKD